jgi:hypothetical protein
VRITIEIDTDDVVGRGDIAWESWCEELAIFLWEAHDGRVPVMTEGFKVVVADLGDGR